MTTGHARTNLASNPALVLACMLPLSDSKRENRVVYGFSCRRIGTFTIIPIFCTMRAEPKPSLSPSFLPPSPPPPLPLSLLLPPLPPSVPPSFRSSLLLPPHLSRSFPLRKAAPKTTRKTAGKTARKMTRKATGKSASENGIGTERLARTDSEIPGQPGESTPVPSARGARRARGRPVEPPEVLKHARDGLTGQTCLTSVKPPDLTSQTA